MYEEFIEQWGEQLVYSAEVVRGRLSRQVGIPKFAYWAALLDPRTKWPTVTLLTAEEKRLLWGDIRVAIVDLCRQRREVDQAEASSDNSNDSTAIGPPHKKRRGAATFLISPASNDEDVNAASGTTGVMGVVSLEAEVSLELSVFEVDPGCRLYDDSQNFWSPGMVEAEQCEVS